MTEVKYQVWHLDVHDSGGFSLFFIAGWPVLGRRLAHFEETDLVCGEKHAVRNPGFLSIAM